MKNSTKIRLHLSKQLFESLTKQVIAESTKGDMSGGAYTEAVKTPKGEKKADKEVKTETKPASSAPQKTKGASKQGVATALKQKGVDLQRDPKANVQSAEGGLAIDLVKQIVDLADNPDNAAPILTKIKRVLDQNQSKSKLPAPPKEERPGGPFFEMETMTAETPMKKGKEQVEEYWGLDPEGTEAIITQIFGGVLGSGILGTIIYGIKNDIKKGKSKKEAALIAAEKLKAAVEKSPDKEK